LFGPMAHAPPDAQRRIAVAFMTICSAMIVLNLLVWGIDWLVRIATIGARIR
jgi:hypothetical protein